MTCDADDYLSIELKRLDLLLHREILRLRAAYQLSLDEFRGLYISDEHVDALIENYREGQTPSTTSTVEDLTQRAAALHESGSTALPLDSPWARLAAEFALSPIEQNTLLLAMAPEIDLKYETLYAYLNNNIARKWPTCELALRVLSNSPSDRIYLRRYLLPQSTLFSENLLHIIDPVPNTSSLACGFSLSPAVVRYLLGFGCDDVRLATLAKTERQLIGWEKIPLAPEELARFRRMVEIFKSSATDGSTPLVILEGRPGAGRHLAAAALCNELDLSLLRVDLETARGSAEPIPKIMEAAILQSRLEQAGLCLESVESLFDGSGKALPEAYSIAASLARLQGPIFFACLPGTRWQDLMRQTNVLRFRFHDPDYAVRVRLWHDALKDRSAMLAESEINALAGRFVLNPGQIGDTVAAAVDAQRYLGPSQTLDVSTLFQSAREQSDGNLGALAVKVNLIHNWDDLVLPAVTLARIRELAAAIRNCHVVYSDWGFDRRIATGKGIKVLFSGSSGTGKTMTAGVIARDLELDLYKIDLSGVVSKYIGETERNLDRIFRAAQSSNAILFFDEADALFGKRSEVKDAHDRYANIEVAYLLQKVEDHEGVVILASNLGKNIDDAFSRRLHYVIDFPQPDETHREQLWRKMFPQEVPLGKDVDYRFLAKQFAIPGGDIKNVALDAAFLAAHDGQVVTMKQLIKAMARQMMKQGGIPSPTEFKQYHALIGQDE